MSTLNIEIRLDNAAFEDNGLENELHNILSAIQLKIATGQKSNYAYDSNGNNVGDFKIIEG